MCQYLNVLLNIKFVIKKGIKIFSAIVTIHFLISFFDRINTKYLPQRRRGRKKKAEKQEQDTYEIAL
jgi:hypothetical protein